MTTMTTSRKLKIKVSVITEATFNNYGEYIYFLERHASRVTGFRDEIIISERTGAPVVIKTESPFRSCETTVYYEEFPEINHETL